MNKHKKIKLFTLLILASVFLSACAGAFGASSWPGITYDSTNNLVYVAYGQSVHALQSENGVEVWRYPNESSNSVSFYAPAQLDASGNLIVGDYNKSVSSINPANNGLLNWTYTEAGDRFIGSSLIVGDQVIIPNADGLLYAFSESGNLQWTFDSGEAIWSTPVSDGENIYVASMNHKLFAINVRTGNQVWEQDVAGTVVSDISLDESGNIYVGTFSQEIVAVSASTGRIQWSSPTAEWIWGGVAAINGSVYAGDLEGNLYALDATNGAEQWRVATGGPITGTPLVGSESVVVGTENGQVISVSLDGRIQWTQNFTGQAYSSPAQAGDLTLVGFVEGDNLVSALDSNGNIVWSFNPSN